MRTLPLDRDTLEMLRDYIIIFGINRLRAWQIVMGCAERVGLPKLVNPETGKLVENAFAEGFIGKLRDECLNQNRFATLSEAKGIIEE